MKLQKTKLGFTLIELLVVITIIGILATGAVSVYTSQIQKARDSTRLTDVTAVKAGIEQFYQDFSEYPFSTNEDATTPSLNFAGILTYTPKLPQDPKMGNKRTNAAFDYIYTVGPDDNDISGQDFEVSTSFENQGNITSKAVGDGGDDSVRLELGIDLTNNATNVVDTIDKALASMKCVDSNGGEVTCATSSTRLLIRKQ